MDTQRDEDLVYIVDWDLRMDPAWRRVYFYKKLRKLRAKFGLHGHMSTKSVLIVKDEKLAWAIHNLALEFGRSNIYEGIPLNGSDI